MRGDIHRLRAPRDVRGAEQREARRAARPEVVIRWIEAGAFTADCSGLLLAETRDLGQWWLLVEALRDTVVKTSTAKEGAQQWDQLSSRTG